jgi:hypothetical protein
MASTPSDKSKSTPGGEPASTPRDLRQYAHQTYDRRPVYLQMRQRTDDKPNEYDPCPTCANTDTEALSNEIGNNWNMATYIIAMQTPNVCNMANETVRNAIPNNCDMATELVLNRSECAHQMDRIVYQLASQDRVKITTNRWSPRSYSGG